MGNQKYHYLGVTKQKTLLEKLLSNHSGDFI